MNLRQRIFSWLTLTLLGLGTTGAILSSYLPHAAIGSNRPVASKAVFALLYIGIFACIVGAGTLLGYSLRASGQRTITENDHWPVVRQSVLVAVGLVALLILQGLRVLSWWDAVLLVIALALVELSFRTRIVS